MLGKLCFKMGLMFTGMGMIAHVHAPPYVAAAAPPTPQQPPPADRTRYEQAMEERLHNDWAYLARYHEENARLGPPAAGERRVVFMGDSITEGWGGPESFFPGKPYINRGISGQTTPQMLIRFRPDVIALKPRVVVILGGTNDIAGNTGPMTLEMTRDNLMSMVDLAQANGIRVVLASVLPAYDFPWRPGLKPAGKIAALNAWLKDYAARKRIVYLDYYSAMVDDRQGLKVELSGDGVHPNAAGYAVMVPLVEKAIARALGRR
jgi:acyl-CoA thioesterase I